MYLLVHMFWQHLYSILCAGNLGQEHWAHRPNVGHNRKSPCLVEVVEGSRPSRGKNPRYREIIDAEAERISDDDKPAKSKRKRKTHTTKGKEKATESDQESAFSADSESDSDSEAGAEISNEEVCRILWSICFE
jgi:hypothetical protein